MKSQGQGPPTSLPPTTWAPAPYTSLHYPFSPPHDFVETSHGAFPALGTFPRPVPVPLPAQRSRPPRFSAKGIDSGGAGSGASSSGAGYGGPPSPPPVQERAQPQPPPAPLSLQEAPAARDAQLAKLQGTLAHWRAWAKSIQDRFIMYNPDIARPARRIYVGGLPDNTHDSELRQFVNELMVRTGGAVSQGFPITGCKLYPEKNYAFLEFRTVEESSNCMALDGAAFKDSHLRIRRPNNYNVNVTMGLGPTEPDPTMDLSSLNVVKTVVPDTPNKLFIGGLPCDWTDDQVKELLAPFGALRAFNLVMDKNTGNSKGYAFCEMRDIGLTDYLISNLNGKPVGNKFLTVKRALPPGQFLM